MAYDTSLNPTILNDFLTYNKVIANRSINTVKEYNYDLVNFLKYMKIYKNNINNMNYSEVNITDIDKEFLQKITLTDLYSYMHYLSNHSVNKPASRARKVASIRAFFKYLTQKAKILEINPAQDLESPKLDKRIPRYLTLDESKKLLNTVNNDSTKNRERDHAIITLFLNCGLRLSELISINIKDIKEDTLTVIGKGNKERTVYLNKACLKALNEYIKVRPKENLKERDALFLSERKQRISKRTVQYIVEKYIERSGLDSKKYTVHKLRHTAATLMYKHGNVDVRALQEILGHESISTTEIYTHVDNEQIKAAVDRNPLANM